MRLANEGGITFDGRGKRFIFNSGIFIFIGIAQNIGNYTACLLFL